MKTTRYVHIDDLESHNMYYQRKSNLSEILNVFRVRKSQILGDLLGCVSVFLIFYISINIGCALDSNCYEAQGVLQ